MECGVVANVDSLLRSQRVNIESTFECRLVARFADSSYALRLSSCASCHALASSPDQHAFRTALFRVGVDVGMLSCSHARRQDSPTPSTHQHPLTTLTNKKTTLTSSRFAHNARSGWWWRWAASRLRHSSTRKEPFTSSAGAAHVMSLLNPKP